MNQIIQAVVKSKLRLYFLTALMVTFTVTGGIMPRSPPT
jgi:hypothetical protein